MHGHLKNQARERRVITVLKIDPKIVSMLEDANVNWTVENGTKHTILKIDGRLAAIFPRNKRKRERNGNDRGNRAEVRRVLERMRQERK